MDYGALPKGRDEARDQAKDTLFGLECSTSRVGLVSFLSGVSTFLVTLIFFNTALYTNRNVVLFFVIAMTVLSVRGIMVEKSPGATTTSVWVRPIGCSCLVAVVLGSIFGLFCYDCYGFFSFMYRNARTYQNTVPSEPAASVSDAGRMVFAQEAYVDQTKASGYAAPNGVVYCVAPIRDMVKTTHVEFWAVGYDCCDWSGSFKCDGATDTSARGGIVVFDNPGIFTTSNRDYYDLARSKAEASYELISAKKPLYVRWVKDDNLGMMQSFYEGRTTGFIMLTTLAYGAVSSMFVYTGSQAYFKTYFGLE